jgi:hypothetical protein
MTGQSTRTIPWQAGFLEFFDLVGEGWTPPVVMKSIVNARRSRMRVEAVFTKPSGARVKLVSRLRKDAEGVWWNVEERLEQSFITRPEPVAHEP